MNYWDGIVALSALNMVVSTMKLLSSTDIMSSRHHENKLSFDLSTSFLLDFGDLKLHLCNVAHTSRPAIWAKHVHIVSATLEFPT